MDISPTLWENRAAIMRTKHRRAYPVTIHASYYNPADERVYALVSGQDGRVISCHFEDVIITPERVEYYTRMASKGKNEKANPV